MKQFLAKDVTFWDSQQQVIPNNAPFATLRTAEGATMQINNQKNGTRGVTIHYDAIHTNHCSIQALDRRVHHIMQHPNGSYNAIISTYSTATGVAKVLGASTITSSVKTAAKAIGLEKNGFPANDVRQLPFTVSGWRNGYAPQQRTL
jgi:uncharacterized BrkB/YihY/UPF0761 family membrane protein